MRTSKKNYDENSNKGYILEVDVVQKIQKIPKICLIFIRIFHS